MMVAMKHAALLSRMGILTRSTTEPETHTGPVVPARPAAPLYSDARGLVAVYRALQILETSARQLTIDVWRGGRRLDRAQRASFLNRPDLALLSFGAFTAETVSSMAQRGNAYWLIKRAGYEIVDVTILDPLHVGVAANDRGIPAYSYKGKPVPLSDIRHLRLTHTPGELLGLSPLQACMATVQGALATQHYADNWTTAGGVPTGILTTDQPITAQQAKDYKQHANKTLQYESGIAVMGNGLKYSPLKLTPAELQFIESRREDVVQVARMFGIPARLMLATIEGGAQTYANLESENQQFVRQTLMTYLAEIEDALTDLAPAGQTVRFNLDGFLRPDTLTRYQAHEIALRAGFLTPGEVREIEGLDPLEETPAPVEIEEKDSENVEAE